jgi:hypothetical protein
MSEPVPPPPGAKKGLSTGAKIAIGCLVVLLLIAGGCFVATAFFVKKGADAVRGFADDMEKDPDAATVKAVEFMMKMNPEVEVVSSDPASGKITLKEKRTGKVVTFNAIDLQNGKLSFESEGETVSLDVDEGEGGEPGALRVASGEKSMVFGADTEEIPDWVPGYSGARVDSVSTLDSAEEASGTFLIHTSDSPSDVLAAFEAALESAGFEVEKSTAQTATATGGNLTATRGNRTVNVGVYAQEGETQGLVAYSEKK